MHQLTQLQPIVALLLRGKRKRQFYDKNMTTCQAENSTTTNTCQTVATGKQMK